MADNWNEQELQALFRKHLPIKQMSPDFAEQLKKQVLTEVAATLGSNQVTNVATEETNTNLVSPVHERTVPRKAPHSIAAPVATSWMDWLRERLRLTPSLTMAGAMVLAVWIFVLWGSQIAGGFNRMVETGAGGGGDDTSVAVLSTPSVDASEIAAAVSPTAAEVAAALTATPEVGMPVIEDEVTPQPTTTLMTDDAVAVADTSDALDDTLVVTAMASPEATTEAGGITLFPTDSLPTATATTWNGVLDESPGTNNPVVTSPTLVATPTPTRILYATATSIPEQGANGLVSPTPTNSRQTATPFAVVPTNTAEPERGGAEKPTATGTRRPAVTTSATPLTLTLAGQATLMATRMTSTSVLFATLTPFEPTSTPSPISTSVVVLVPTSTVTRAILPWKSPTPTVTRTSLPTATSTATATATRIFAPTATVVEPTSSPLPTVPPVVNTPVPTAIIVSAATATNLPAPTSTLVPTSTPAPTDTPAPTSTLAPTNTPWPTSTSTAVPTNTSVPTWTAVPTNTPLSPTATSTTVPTNTPLPPPTATSTAVPTNTPLPPPTVTSTWTAVPTNTPLPPPTATSTAVPTNTPLPTATNAAPMIVSTHVTSWVENKEYIYVVQAIDSDGPPTALQFFVLEPTWLRFEDPVGGYARLYGMPPAPGDYTVRIQVSDGFSSRPPTEFIITVSPAPSDEVVPSQVISDVAGGLNADLEVVAANLLTATETLSDTAPSD